MKVLNIIQERKIQAFFIFVIAFGIFARIYNLSWGAPFFFHPDERNIASSVTKLSFPSQMNPEFFAYGSLPIYTIYFLGIFKNTVAQSFLQTNSDIFIVLFEDAILIGRIVSLTLSILLLYLIFKTTLLISDIKASLVATSLSLLSIGFIQYSHFMTFEIWLSFFLTLLLFLTIRYYKNKSILTLLLIGISLGILVSIKVSSLLFVPIILLLIFIEDIKVLIKSKKFNILKIEFIILKLLGTVTSGLIMVFVTSPFFWLDKESFVSSIAYETEVATGTLPVFYTQSFTNTIPILYQLTKVYPFILNPIVLVSFLVVFPFILIESFRKKSTVVFLVILFFLLAFFSQAFLFVKWIRYYIPTLSFIYILIGYFFSRNQILNKKYSNLIIAILIVSSFIYAFSFIKTVYFKKPSQIAASEWAYENIKGNPKILSEVYDMGIVPFNNFRTITLFNFYDLETDPLKKRELDKILEETDYIIIPSQRIYKDRIANENLYPLGYKFYEKLLNETTEFLLVYQTPCDIFCKITYANDPINSYEGTSNVFDRPVVSIFKKL